jgi:natural product precursor
MDSIKLTKLQKKEMKNLIGGEPPKCSCTCDCVCHACEVGDTIGQVAGANQAGNISLGTISSFDSASTKSESSAPVNPGAPQG